MSKTLVFNSEHPAMVHQSPLRNHLASLICRFQGDDIWHCRGTTEFLWIIVQINGFLICFINPATCCEIQIVLVLVTKICLARKGNSFFESQKRVTSKEKNSVISHCSKAAACCLIKASKDDKVISGSSMNAQVQEFMFNCQMLQASH